MSECVCVCGSESCLKIRKASRACWASVPVLSSRSAPWPMWCSLLELSFNDVEPKSFTYTHTHTHTHTTKHYSAAGVPHPPAYLTDLLTLNKEPCLSICVCFSRIHPITNIACRSFPVPLRVPHLKCRLRSRPRHSLILPINLKIPLKSQSDGAKPGALLHFRSHADEEPNRPRRPSLSQSRRRLPLKRWLKLERSGLVFISQAKNTSWSKGSARGAEKRERQRFVLLSLASDPWVLCSHAAAVSAVIEDSQH